MIKKFFFGLFACAVVYLLNVRQVQAGLVLVKPDGNLTLSVLGLSVEKSESLAIKEIALGQAVDAQISFEKDSEGKISLNITSAESSQAFDVTGYKDEIVEIEERAEARRVSIFQENGQFLIKQKEITAATDYLININPKTAEITVVTPTGARYLAILPYNAYETALRAKIVSGLPINNRLELKEDPSGKLAYVIVGEKVIDLFQIVKYQVPVTTNISATTGEVLSIEAPSWYKILGFLFT